MTSPDNKLKPKERMAIPVQDMPTRDAAERRTSMEEVALGYSREQAVLEAQRCLQCPTAPCVKGCPVSVPIPAFIDAVAKGEFAQALDKIRETNLLPSICGRVCPQESQCQQGCTVGISLKSIDKAVSIGRLERFVGDWGRENVQDVPQKPASTGKKVAVVGGGPAGIACAADLARFGHEVTLFEAFPKVGGVMVYGIPEFRLPKSIVEKETQLLADLGVNIVTNFLVGRSRSLQALLDEDGFDAAFIGSGAGLPKFMNTPGENLVGVFSANEYLTRSNLMKAWDKSRAATPQWEGKKVAVVGGGNVAMDASRTALRLGADKVYIIYRRTEAEMPARREEVHHAHEEGVEFLFLRNPKTINGNEQGRVSSLTLSHFELGEADASGRRSPVLVPDQESTLDVDTVIVAIGNDPHPLLSRGVPGLELDKRGNIITDQEGRTSLPKVWAGGDIVLGAATVILAMGEGRKAAASINRSLGGN